MGGGSGVVFGGGDAAQVAAAAEPVAVAFEGDDLGVVHEPVDHRGGDYVVAEDFTPPIWGWLMFVLVGSLLVVGQNGCRLVY